MQMSREFFKNTNCKKFIRICVKFSDNARKGKPAVNFLREEFLNRNHPETYQEDFRLICYSLGRPALAAVAHLFNMSISLPIISSIDLSASFRLPFCLSSCSSSSSNSTLPLPLSVSSLSIYYDFGSVYSQFSAKTALKIVFCCLAHYATPAAVHNKDLRDNLYKLIFFNMKNIIIIEIIIESKDYYNC